MKYNKAAIENFFNGRMSKKEAIDFLEWLHSDQGKSVFEELTEQAWKDIGEGGKPKEVRSVYDITSRPAIVQEKRVSAENRKRSNLYRLGKYSLPVLMLLFVVVSASFYIWKNQLETIASEAELEINMLVKSTPKGRKSKVVLPDGSVVHLNSESQISYPDNFKENRTVALSGEAFFEVVKDQRHPFEVVSGTISTTALGTSFNIKAYPDTDAIQVSLATGKVQVREVHTQQEVTMDPGNALKYNGLGSNLLVEPVKISNVLLWKEGILSFDKTPFSEVIDTIERWYGVDVVVLGSGNIPNDKCSGTFEPNEYLSNVLNALGYSMNFKYTITEKLVTITFNTNRP
jgi:transmembrane sensor